MNVVLALAPVAVVIIALLARQSAFRAASLGTAVAVVVAITVFSLDVETTMDAARAWWPLPVEVLAILAGGIAFAEVGRRTGMQAELSRWLSTAFGSGVAPVLAIVHGVTPFAESVTGFGIGAVIAVPLLVALGLDGRRAATIGLLGLCTVPWGSLGPGTLIAAELGGVGFDALGVASAVASLPVFIGVGVVAALLVADPHAKARACLLAVGSGASLWVGILLANTLIGTSVAGVLGALMVIVAHLFVGRLRGRRSTWSRQTTRAFLPYGVLVGGVVVAGVVLRILDAGAGPWRVIASPALWLIVAAAVAERRDPGSFRAVRATVLRTWLRVGPATGLFLILGMTMAVSGMSAAVAGWLAGAGPAFAFAVPVIGAVGGFVTGSNSGASAMFATPQAAAALATGIPALPALAAHNVAASVAIMASPARVELAVSLCPDEPQRSGVLRTLVLLDATIVAILAVGLFAAAHISSS